MLKIYGEPIPNEIQIKTRIISYWSRILKGTKIQIKTRMISYWSRILTGKDTKMAKLIYNLGISMNQEMLEGEC